jgi:hypothetical protein
VKRLRRAAWWTAAAVLVLAVAAAVAVRMLDTPAARAALERKLSEAANGEVSWDSLELRLLPRPRGVLQGIRAEMPGVRLSAARLEAVLRLAPLFRGRVEIDSIALVQPDIRLEPSGEKPAAGSAQKKSDPFAILQAFAADAALVVRDASFEMKVGDGGRTLALRRLSLEAHSSGDAVRIDLADAAPGAELALDALPGPLTFRGGSITLTRGQAALDSVAVAMLDARARVSGTASGYAQAKLQVEASAGGDLGPQIARWAVASAGKPQLEPATPLRFTLTRLRWRAGQPLQAAGQLRVERGPQVTFDLAWTPKLLDVRRLAIKDGHSDVVASARVEAQRIQWSYSGVLEVESIGDLFKTALPGTGRLAGNYKATVDRRDPRRSTANGKLQAENFDLEWLAQRPLRVVRLDVNVDDKTLNIGELTLDALGQSATLRGEIRLGGQVPVLDASLESPGIDVDALLKQRPPAEKKESPPKEPSKLWPLPVNGSVAVNAGFVRFAGREAKPVTGTLKLEPKRAALELRETLLCGVGFPLTAEAAPGRVSGRTTVSVKAQKVDEAIRCLTGEAVELSGTATVRAELATAGASKEELLRNLSGGVEGEIAKGTVGKMKLLGQILTLRNFADISELSKHGGEAEGLPYRRIVVKGRFHGGQFHVDESAFDSDAVRLAASGEVGLVAPDTKLTVMVAPLAHVDRAVGAIPIVGHVLGGALTAVPVGVTGDIRDPLIVPLGPRAITEDVLGVFERAFKLPTKLIVPAETKEEK